ncbi:glycosyltransferase family 61 protein [Spirosoma pomorum]
MATMNYLVSTIRKTLKNQAPLLARPFGLDMLSRTQTEAYLRPSLIARSQSSAIQLPATRDYGADNRLIFDETAVTSAATHVWACQNANQRMHQLRNGSVRSGAKVLDTDFGTSTLFSDLFATKKRTVRETQLLIAPWSHYWGGYYDYLLFVVAKLCRIKNALPEADFAKAVVAYPLLNTSFEQELLAQLGIRPDNIIDSRTHALQFDTCFLGDNDPGWFYPNRTDVLALQRQVMANTPLPTDTPKRLYISRAGRRRVRNEAALIRLLETYGFTPIEDKPRSLAEQVALYSNASHIVGPHGASFANILWCQPGTQLLELFAPNYAPDYFRYLAHLLGLHYTAHCAGPVGTYDHAYVNADLSVALGPLERRLDQLVGVRDISH